MNSVSSWESRLQDAVKLFWQIRGRQAKDQGGKSGSKDAGNRSAVTGGKQLDGFVNLIRDFLVSCGIQEEEIYCDHSLELPGWFRAEKKWDLLVVICGKLIAAMEFKSQIGSFGNNFNNRAEESIGSATDIWTAYREGAFALSQRPWLGYMMLLEDAPKVTEPVQVKEPHFPVFRDFRDASYAQRYEILITKLIRERLYDSAALILSSEEEGKNGKYREIQSDLSFMNLLLSLKARVMAMEIEEGRR